MTFGSLDDLRDSYGEFSTGSSSSFHVQLPASTQANSPGPIPHQGALCRVEGESEVVYVLSIQLEDKKNPSSHELQFGRQDFEFALRLFAILDVESRGLISKEVAKEFVTLRCPVFWRRDDDLRAHQSGGKPKPPPGSSPTFDEVWKTVVTCSLDSSSPSVENVESYGEFSTEESIASEDEDSGVLQSASSTTDTNAVELGVEGWMVFCRFVALAQYLEAKRRFSGRHLQQTMRHRNAPRGSELVMVDVPPAAPPLPLNAAYLASYERESQKRLPVPELDLDHSLLAAHDVLKRRRKDVFGGHGRVKIDLFGPSPSRLAPGSSSKHSIDFCLTYFKSAAEDPHSLTVRRSMKDLLWLNETLISHKTLGGTLCGRILPPFPGKNAQLYQDDSSGSTGDALAAAATAGVGILKAGIKTLWGSVSPKLDPKLTNNINNSGVGSLPENYYNPNSPACKARQLERYLNYLLEHPALSTSFPLNTILKASQSGLEAAKQSLEEHARTAKEIKEQTPSFEDGSVTNFWPISSSSSSQQPNLTWVRTAAQAAVALQLHGVLETTGLPSASARLQHASLPNFDNARNHAWSNDEGDHALRNNDSDSTTDGNTETNFEEGVEQVQDELECDDLEEDNTGYDLLPLPVPAPERKILSVSNQATSPDHSSHGETRFRYGGPCLQNPMLSNESEDGKPAYIGEMAVDENIDKLREVIGSVDDTLSRCMTSSASIGKARRQSLALHLDVLRGLDSWEGLRGKFVAQRALLKGVSGIEQSREVFEESDLGLIDDVSWQTALANSAVSAAEDVRSAVRAARTASSAKSAAISAAEAASNACETKTFHSSKDARAAQTRNSIAQSHAIHSAVVEHEAKTVKRRATLALAHDVKCWNAHRKREVLQTALAYAKSQHEGARRAVDAWSCLRDGYIGSTIIPSTQARRSSVPQPTPPVENMPEEVQAFIYGAADENQAEQPQIVAVEHEMLKQSADSSSSSSGGEIISPEEPETILPFVVASPIPEEDEGMGSSAAMDDVGGTSSDSQGIKTSSIMARSVHSQHLSCSSSHMSSSRGFSRSMLDGEDNEIMSSSMQSLVDGLMSWGGQYDDDDDLALPSGMAASIALEESGVLGSHHHKHN